MSCLICPRAAAIYRPRRPEKTTLHQVIRQHYKKWLVQQEPPVPLYIEREFHNYLQCGILGNGFAYGHCNSCNEDFLIAFSCKGRGICPSCNQRNMVEVAAHLTECLIIPEAQFGAVSFTQRFGNNLNYHPHFHILVGDGVCATDTMGEMYFHEGMTTPEVITEMEEAIRRRVLRLFQRRKLLTKETVETMLAYEHSGFSFNTAVKIESWDAEGLERLVRYCARPSFASENLRFQSGYVVYRLPKETHTGIRQIQLI